MKIYLVIVESDDVYSEAIISSWFNLEDAIQDAERLIATDELYEECVLSSTKNPQIVMFYENIENDEDFASIGIIEMTIK